MPSVLTEDYYQLLGVSAGADAQALRRAWRQLAARWHPDRAGQEATVKFQKLSAAYAVLSNPVARAAYDRRRPAAKSAGRRWSSSDAPAKSPNPPSRQAAPAVMLSRHCGQLASLLACGALRLDESDYITLVLREAEAIQGGMAMISMPVELSCPQCAAQGQSQTCPRCGGRRTIDELFTAWLAVPPRVSAGQVLLPTVELPGMVEPVRFRVRFSASAIRS